MDERRARLPRLEYPPALPILLKKEEIVAAVRKHPVVVVTGETGSGKTTQIPKMCLEAGRGLAGLIGCTQPRRIAATTVARRIAEEMGEEVGHSVGYKIRFDDRTPRSAFLKIMTDGILLMEAQTDPLLRAYDTIIIDEAHERSLNIDFILGILKNILVRRRDLRVVITSATIDTEKFSRAFDDAPIIEVSGRLYPVEVRYDPLDRDLEEKGEINHIDAAVRAVEELTGRRRPGDILIFMPTERDIRETRELLSGRLLEEVAILPLFSRLTRPEQERVFQPMNLRKIIIATNVAETSLTIPGIRYVIDTGLARISQYNPRSRTAGLPVRAISQSSADQRKGRCGRVENGICIRLFTEEDYLGRPLYTSPEILRSNLAGVILRMLALDLGDIDAFPFIDRPAPKSIRDGIDILLELGAIEREEDESRRKSDPWRLTERGRIMARLPIDPRIARMILEAKQEECITEILVIAAALSSQDPRERPAEKEAQADQMHALFKDPASDFVSLLRIWLRCHDAIRQASLQNRRLELVVSNTPPQCGQRRSRTGCGGRERQCCWCWASARSWTPQYSEWLYVERIVVHPSAAQVRPAARTALLARRPPPDALMRDPRSACTYDLTAAPPPSGRGVEEPLQPGRVAARKLALAPHARRDVQERLRERHRDPVALLLHHVRGDHQVAEQPVLDDQALGG